jgi:hypothetical protein
MNGPGHALGRFRLAQILNIGRELGERGISLLFFSGPRLVSLGLPHRRVNLFGHGLGAFQPPLGMGLAAVVQAGRYAR